MEYRQHMGGDRADLRADSVLEFAHLDLKFADTLLESDHKLSFAYWPNRQ